MRLPDLSVGKKYLERVAAGVLTSNRVPDRMRRNQTGRPPGPDVDIPCCFFLKNRPHDPAGSVFRTISVFWLPRRLSILNPPGSCSRAWRRGSPAALDLLRQAQTNHLTTEEHLAAPQLCRTYPIWIRDLAAAGAAFQAGAGLKKCRSAYGLGRVAELKNDYPWPSGSIGLPLNTGRTLPWPGDAWVMS